MCGLWAFDRVKPAEELVEPWRNNPTIQNQACNSRGKEMSGSLLGRQREQKKARGQAERGVRLAISSKCLNKLQQFLK